MKIFNNKLNESATEIFVLAFRYNNLSSTFRDETY